MKLTDLIPEKEITETVLSDYEKKLILYKFTNEQLKKKYGMNYEQFERKNIVKERNFTWDVEQDAMHWEHAIAGIKYLEEKIKKIKEINSEN